jgi:nucleoid-associated protein YgaU
MIWYALGSGAVIAAAAVFAIEQNLDLPIPSLRSSSGEPVATSAVSAPAAPVQAPAKPSATKPNPKSAPVAAALPAPQFDIVRVEPDGDTVVAGRAAPGAKVELRDDERALASVAADDSGQFVILPEPLTAGSHHLRLAARVDNGESRLSDVVEVEVAPHNIPSPSVVASAELPEAKPKPAAPSPTALAVSSSAPNPPAPSPVSTPSPQPSVAVAALPPKTDVKSALPTAPGSIGGARVAVGSVKATEQGRLEAEGHADPGTRLRLTLNGAYLAEVVAGLDGLWSLTIEHGMTAGLYTLEAQQLGPGEGARAQASFAYPQSPAPPVAPLASTAQPASPPIEALNPSAERSPEAAIAQAIPMEPMAAPQPAAATSIAPSPPTPLPPGPKSAVDPSHAVVAEVRTTRVARGDNLWDLARRFYGDGLRYADIYSANAAQIRNPNLIYIGQVFVVPQGGPRP